jgi:acetoacetyl-CoA synthetase
MTEPVKLWAPSAERSAASNLAAFARQVGMEGAGYDAIHDWSVAEPEAFWTAVWDFTGVVAERRGERVLVDGDRLEKARFFPDARLNFAQNLLRRRDDTPALVFRGEDRFESRMTWNELHDLVSRLHAALKAMGVRKGDRVAGFLPNMPETVAAMLAATSLGAVWSSCSPDFGVKGVLDRFGQIAPKVLFTADGYVYGGRRHDSLERIGGILAELPDIAHVIVIPYTEAEPDITALGDRAAMLGDAIAEHPAGEIDYVMTGFNDPLYIMYSSGTTGLPKCIVHGVGGTLLQHLKEHRLQADVRPGDPVFYFTTCGWMMWNWLVSGLASEATLLLFDGSPFHPDAHVIFDYIADEKAAVFGTSAKYIDACLNEGVRPKDTHDLSSVRTVLSTGSPLAPASFDHVYRDWKADVQLASMSGGTDILACFVGGAPGEPVWRGEIQKPQLGLDVRVLDDGARPVTGEQGELCCLNAHPSMPLGFWNDEDGSRYHDAYFARFDNVWCHGDWVAMTERRGVVIYGRSDATLNPGGVRIGTAEIYRQVEAMEEILEALVIGQDWDNDVRVVLFVRLAEGVALDGALEKKIRNQIRQNATPRHVPAKIVAVADIPRTLSGKIVELAVRNVVHGRPVKNRDALANPDALELFRDLPELRD